MRAISRIRRLIWTAYCMLASVPFASAQGYSTTVPPNTALTDTACYNTVTTAVSNETVLNSIHIKTPGDIASTRAALSAQIWGTNTLPTRTVPAASIVPTIPPTANNPGNLATNASAIYAALTSASPSYLGTEYRLTWSLLTSPVVNSIIFEWTPKVSNGRLFIVHDGHSDDAYVPQTGVVWAKALQNTSNQITVSALLQLGYTVVWIQMPLYGDNLSFISASDSALFPQVDTCPNDSNPPAPNLVNLSNCVYRHDGIFLNPNTWGNPWRHFIEPVIVAINTAVSQHGPFTDITMMGASGGGWTTVLAAAIDPRITNSASVAGSLPLFFPSANDATSCPLNRDAEQSGLLGQAGLLYGNVSYLDLYIMAANGTDPNGVHRRHMQINNQFDTCCFFGINFLGYVPTLSGYIAKNSLGNYKYYLNTTFVGHAYDLGYLNGVAVSNKTLGTVRQIPAVTIILNSLVH